jgi:antitoxin YefM
VNHLRVHDHHGRVTVAVHGKPSAILIAPEDLEALEETLEIMRDPAEDSHELRTTSIVRRALGETLPEAVAAAAYGVHRGSAAHRSLSDRQKTAPAYGRPVQRPPRNLPHR